MMKLLTYTSILLAFAFLNNVNAQNKQSIEHFKCSRVHQHNFKTSDNENLNKYDVHFYFLDIEASNKSTAVKGSTSIGATCKNESLNEFVIELNSGIAVSSALVNNEEQTFAHNNNEVVVSLKNAIEPNDTFTVKINYDRPGTLNTDGIYCYENNFNKKVTYTLSEPFYAKNWFACKEDLYDKADSVYVFVTIDNSLKVGSNGLLTNITDMGNNKVRYEWKSHYPIAYYLISIAIAEYKEHTDYAKPRELNGDSILIQNYFYDNAQFNNTVQAFEVTADMIEVFSDLFTLYPFWKEKYGHCFAPLGGAMEHQTMTTTGSTAEYITAHELGHQWFGDNITCATWQDIWINEGFASYSEYLWFESKFGKEIAYEHLVYAQSGALNARQGSIYVPFDELSDGRIFSSSLSYDKGSCFVHMIRHEINNDELFFEALRAYQQKFTDSVATGDDFNSFFSEYTKTDLDAMFNEWYYGEGYPRYEITWQQNNGKISINIYQETTASTQYFTNNIDFKLSYNGGDTLIWLKPTSENSSFEIEFEKEITNIELDPGHDILKAWNSGVVDINEVENTFYLNCYPNPFTNLLTIENPAQQMLQIKVFDIQGKLIKSVNSNNNQLSINTEKWREGAYTLLINGNKHFLSKTIIKK